VAAGSKHFDLAVNDDNIVVVVYFDEVNQRLRLRHSNAAVTGTQVVTWADSPVVLPEYVGNYVSMVKGADNSLHLAAFDAANSDLKYIYIPDFTQNGYTEVMVDQYGSVGNWTQIALRGGVPYISYYNATETGGRDPIKLAYAKSTASSLLQGVDYQGYTLGNWEYATAPAIDPPQGGNPKFQKVNLGFTSAGNGARPVLGYLGTNIEFSYPVGE
jgi:hypothetical protein